MKLSVGFSSHPANIDLYTTIIYTSIDERLLTKARVIVTKRSVLLKVSVVCPDADTSLLDIPSDESTE